MGEMKVISRESRCQCVKFGNIDFVGYFYCRSQECHDEEKFQTIRMAGKFEMSEFLPWRDPCSWFWNDCLGT